MKIRLTISTAAIIALALCAWWMTRAPQSTPPIEKPTEAQSPIPPALRAKIDQWIAANQLNRYGDPAGTQYTGGTPLFDPRTGVYKDRYVYILERHPELKIGQ